MSLFGGMSDRDVVDLLRQPVVRDELTALLRNALYARDRQPCHGNTFGDDEAARVFAVYRNLDARHKQALSNVIVDANLMAFVVSGCLADNLILLWDYCKRLLLNQEDAAELITIFNFYFELAEKGSAVSRYERLSVENGEQYDEARCLNIKSALSQGIVKEVLFQGFKYAGARGKVVRRTVVAVAGV